MTRRSLTPETFQGDFQSLYDILGCVYYEQSTLQCALFINGQIQCKRKLNRSTADEMKPLFKQVRDTLEDLIWADRSEGAPKLNLGSAAELHNALGDLAQLALCGLSHRSKKQYTRYAESTWLAELSDQHRRDQLIQRLENNIAPNILKFKRVHGYDWNEEGVKKEIKKHRASLRSPSYQESLGCVYVISHIRAPGKFKVGKTKDFVSGKRFINHEKCYPGHNVVRIFRSHHYQWLEKMIQIIFQGSHLQLVHRCGRCKKGTTYHREWFKVDEDILLTKIEELVDEVEEYCNSSPTPTSNSSRSVSSSAGSRKRNTNQTWQPTPLSNEIHDSSSGEEEQLQDRDTHDSGSEYFDHSEAEGSDSDDISDGDGNPSESDSYESDSEHSEPEERDAYESSASQADTYGMEKLDIRSKEGHCRSSFSHTPECMISLEIEGSGKFRISLGSNS